MVVFAVSLVDILFFFLIVQPSLPVLSMKLGLCALPLPLLFAFAWDP